MPDRTASARVVVVGASLAGVRTAEALRSAGFGGEVVVVGAEDHFPPYDRPPLSKQVLAGEWEPERARLRAADDLHLDLRLGRLATALDVDRRHVTLNDGTAVDFDGLVVATGATPRPLPVLRRNVSGVVTLRTLGDCLALQRALRLGARLVVIGAGFVGMEVAATARLKGVDVTVVDPLPAPMMRGVGAEMGRAVAKLHAAYGVRQRFGVAVHDVMGDYGVEAVALSDGSVLDADAVLVAIGVAPETRWLAGSGLNHLDGLACESTLFAKGADNIVGAGDVTRWDHPLFGRPLRVEHWTNAVGQAHAAGRNLARHLVGKGEALEEFVDIPYFWSHQYDWQLQLVGLPTEDVHIEEGSVSEGRFVAAYWEDERVVGMLCVNRPGRLAACRRRILNDSRLPR